jgi:hypothetical protein
MKAATSRRLRSLHFYLGMFFAPAIVFFAVSGGVQTFRLNEAGGYGGPPPAWMVWVASVHKNQTTPRPRPPRPEPPAGARKPDAPRGGERRPSTLPLKIFVAVMAFGLTASALLGIAIALSVRSLRRGSLVMLALGTVLPLILLLA